MSSNLTNHRETMLLMGDILDENVKFSQQDCVVLQKFDYVFERSCNGKGIPFGTTVNPVVEFTIKFLDESRPKSILELLNSMDMMEASFLFNVSFDKNRKVSDYDNAIVVRGYVVDVEQNYHCSALPGEESQKLLRVKLLAADVTYAGDRSQNKTLVISRRI